MLIKCFVNDDAELFLAPRLHRLALTYSTMLCVYRLVFISSEVIAPTRPLLNFRAANEQEKQPVGYKMCSVKR